MLYARRKGWTVGRVEVRLSHGQREGATGRMDHVEIELLLQGNLTPEQESRLREVADRCPVHRALRGEIDISERRRG